MWQKPHTLHVAEATLGLAHRLSHHARSHARRVATSRTAVRRGEHRRGVVHRRAAVAEKPQRSGATPRGVHDLTGVLQMRTFYPYPYENAE